MILPDKYQGLDEDELKLRILHVKKRLGDKLVILGHHYQRDDVFQFADLTGDSFKLSQDAAMQENARYIVFCGVHFMAESAKILCDEDQRVFLPDLAAGCPMAEMASLEDVEAAWTSLSEITDISKVVPITYMNSQADIKAFCGLNDGAVCTSSNAGKIFKWAFERGEKIFFLPDQHLGRNTARSMGITGDQVVMVKPEEFECGLTKEDVARSRVILWNGFCHVHTFFTLEHVREMREKYLGCKIIVHPECPEEVVLAVDATGSTEQIKKYVDDAAQGSLIVVGTEVNMVNRLSLQNPGKTIVPLARSLCPNMFKISLNDLLWTLEEIGKVNEIFVEEDITIQARIALQKMLENG